MRLVLHRIGKGPDGTVGTLGTADNPNRWATFEEEDQANQRNISRIPAGTYWCEPRRYNRGDYDTYEVTGVPGRSDILFHILNTEEDTAGCIGVGQRHGVLRVADEDFGTRRYKAAILASTAGFQSFMEYADPHGFWLVIHDEGEGQ